MTKPHLISCARCGHIHPWGQCPKAKDPRIRYYKSEARTDAQRFRSSRTWQRKTEEIKRRDKYLCRLCLFNGRINNRDLSVHHIVPIAKANDRRLDNDNLITLCSECHRKIEGDGSATDLLVRLAISPPEESLK